MEENLLVAGTVLADLVVSSFKGKMITQDQFEDCMSVAFMAIVHHQLFLNAKEMKEKEKTIKRYKVITLVPYYSSVGSRERRVVSFYFLSYFSI